MSWYLIVLPLTYLGGDIVLAREIGRRRESASALLGATFGMRTCAALLVTSVLLVTSELVERDTYLAGLIALFSCALIGRSLWMWSASVFTAFEEARLTLRFEVASRLLELFAVLLVIKLLGAELYDIAMAHAFSWLLQGIAATVYVFRRYSPNFQRPNVEWIRLLREGSPGAAFSISTAIFFQLPIVLFGRIEGGGNSLGYFALAVQVISYFVGISTLIASAALPVLSRSAARQDGKDRLAALFMIGGIFVVGASLALAASLLGHSFVTFLFGDRYAGTVAVLQASLWLFIPASIAILFQNVLFSNQIRTLVPTIAPLLGVATMLVLFPASTRAEGYLGALLAVAAGLVMWTFLAAAETLRIGFFKRPITGLNVNR
jgi:O-antigen/teichoic acid export membrane protein